MPYTGAVETPRGVEFPLDDAVIIITFYLSITEAASSEQGYSWDILPR